jgi:hypothetical protein
LSTDRNVRADRNMSTDRNVRTDRMLCTDRNLRSDRKLSTDSNLRTARKFRSDCNSILFSQCYEYCSENIGQKCSFSVPVTILASAANLQI